MHGTYSSPVAKCWNNDTKNDRKHDQNQTKFCISKNSFVTVDCIIEIRGVVRISANI